jgi:hypothetical protein
MGWATLREIFSQTHLVTLVAVFKVCFAIYL